MHCVVLFLLLGFAHAAPAATPKPNIVFVLADDLGYNELNFMNDTRGILTPHLDSLAHAGVVLKNYYVQPICSPTRSAFMTGRYTVRLGTQGSVIFWDTPWGIALNETFIPQNLKDAGYDTAMFGKWHLGMYKQDYTPRRRGFDEHMGYYQGCESAFTHVSACCSAGSPTSDQNYTCVHQKHLGIYPPYEGEAAPQHLPESAAAASSAAAAKDQKGYDWFKSDPTNATGVSEPDFSANHTNSAILIRDAAIDFLGRQKGKSTPFFLYLPFQNIHGPYTCIQEYKDQYANSSVTPALTDAEQTMFGYLTEMDTTVGAIIATMKANGQYANSVILFSSDNGAPPAGVGMDHAVGPMNPGWIARNYPFRGHKGLIWEGGTRVAGFVHSPRADLLPDSVRGTTSHELYHVTDWLPTIVSLAGGNTDRNHALDGHDIWPSVSTGSPSPRTEMLYNVNPLCKGGQAGSPKAGLRMGSYKVLAWCYSIKGIGGGNVTGPVNAPKGSKAANIDPEFTKGPVLYNLDDDPAETTNLATKQPDVLAKMLARLAELAEGSVEPMQWTPPYQGPTYECKDCPLHPGGTGVDKAWLPWL